MSVPAEVVQIESDFDDSDFNDAEFDGYFDDIDFNGHFDDIDFNGCFDDFDAALLQRIPWLDTPLHADRNMIRILRLQRGRGKEQIKCGLFVASLDESPVYETLSYVWGDPNHTKTILVCGEQFEATVNLVDFLEHLRCEDVDRFIWADAICIDQLCVKEKYQQLELMSRIYRQGTEAHIWFGAFNASWATEIAKAPLHHYDIYHWTRTSDLTPEDWESVEKVGQQELSSFQSAGGVAPDKTSYLQTRDESLDGIFSETVDILSSSAYGRKMHEFPLYLRHGHKHCINRHWLTLVDCIRWMVTRPWWSRVWTFQEAVLPARDSTVHTTRHSFPLSILLRGLYVPREECRTSYKDKEIKHTALFWASYQGFPQEYYDRVIDLREQRLTFLDLSANDPLCGQYLGNIIYTTQQRSATDIRDHFYGIFALLSPDLQRWWMNMVKDKHVETTAQIFAACTKLVFYSLTPTLKYLGEAIGRYDDPLIKDLPTWAINFRVRRPDFQSTNSKWGLYDACGGTLPRVPPMDSSFFSLKLRVEGLKIGTVRACSKRPSLGKANNLVIGREWLQIYRTGNDRADETRFWRTAFMDRDIWKFWLHKRHPLYPKRVRDIIAWWKSYEDTGDSHDLTSDGMFHDGRRGDYHGRALDINMVMMLFFTTEAGEPGLGPDGLRPGDEVFLLKGNPALAMLSRVSHHVDRINSFRFVGSCFVDGYMYGEALRRRRLEWEELDLV